MNNLAVVHVVRRFGLVGGMEGYVWELTHTLSTIGVVIEVICEEVYGSPSPKIRIHLVKKRKCSSRWKEMMRFRDAVNSLIERQFANRNIIIHSHERTLNHHITTFHGPPMTPKTDWWRFSILSRRIKAWKKMEQEELLAPQVQFILPVSNLIKDRLVSLYPCVKTKSTVTAYPGVAQATEKQKCLTDRNQFIPHFAFVGKEWKRKGLEFAVNVVDYYASHFEPCILDIYGPNVSDLPKAIRHHPNIMARGWAGEIPWHKYNALIHPAKNEPFGMVIPEARSHGVPVLTTNQVGSTELNYDGVTILDSRDSAKMWADTLNRITREEKSKRRAPEIKWTWRDLALQHINDIYPMVIIK